MLSGMRARAVIAVSLAATAQAVSAHDGLLLAPEEPEHEARLFEGSDIEPIELPPWRPIDEQSLPCDSTTWAWASTIGAGGRAFTVHLGFPFMVVDYQTGTTEKAELRASFRTMYGGMAQLEASGRLRVQDTPALRLTLRLGAAYASFSADEAVMWLTRTRGLALHPGAVVALAVGRASLFADIGSQIVVDVDPPSPPLGGPSARTDVLVNLPVRLGAQMPVSSRTSFVGKAGFDLFLGGREAGEPVALAHFTAGLSFAR